MSNIPPELESPSPFAEYIVKQIPENAQIIDVGCGNGRDSIFFLNHGFSVTALDGSSSAIQKLCNAEPRFKINQNLFILNFDNIRETEKSANYLSSKFTNTESAIYARFFLHAMSELAQESFFDWATDILKPGEFIFLEYRSPQLHDFFVMGTHYRRLIEAKTISEVLIRLGYEIIESSSSNEFAPFKSESAMVSRTIARKLS